MDKEKALKNQGSEFREDISSRGGIQHMNELFFNDITQSRYIDNLCYFSRSMKEHMLSSFIPGAFGRTDLQNVFDVLKGYIYSLSYCIPYIPHEYFDHYFDQMCYEITLDICVNSSCASH